MRRALLGLVCLVACGGRTELGGETLGEDGGIIPTDGSVSDSPNSRDVTVSDGPILPDVAPPPFDSGPPVGPPIQCGMTTCNSADQVCCLTFMGMTGGASCTAPTACMGIPLACSSAIDCPMGEVCCGSFGGMGAPPGSRCRPMCMGGFNNPQLCASSAECPTGLTCQPTPFGYKVCR